MRIKKQALKLISLLSIALLAVLVLPGRAAADDDDPPSRVARLGYTHGAVSFQPAGTDDWVDAVVNRPLTTGDKLWSASGSRVELHLGSAAIRLGSTTGFSFLNLTDNTTQIRLTEGTLNIRVRRLDDDDTFEIDTPNLAFTVLRPGNYKINVNEGGDTTLVVVRDGQGEATGAGQAYTIHPREVGTFTGTDELDADVESWENNDDDFDVWSAQRDARMDHSASSQYVSTDVIGYEDLDDNGGWRPVPEYGNIWFPRTAVVGWAPYRYGHWAYVAPWGYTWVDDAPWGFAPFHYGRWVTVGGVWGWVPAPPRPVAVVGVVYVRPVYAPALVAWVGGPHFAVGIGVGGGGGFAAGVSVGWFPLGPREVFVPSYPVSRAYVSNVNVSNTTVNTTVVNNYYNTTVINRNTTVNNTNVTVNQQHYMNQGVPGAVSATTPQAFTSAQSVSKNAVTVNAKEVASAPVAATTPAVTPAKQSVLGSGASAAAKPPAALQNRAVVAKSTPPPPPPSFEKRQAAITANGGRPIAMSQAKQLAPPPSARTAAVKIAPPSKPAVPQNVKANGGNKPVNAPAAQTSRPPVANAPAAQTNTNRPPNANVPAAQTNNNRPPAPKTSTPPPAPSALDQKHQQQQQDLQKQQESERQSVQQQQAQERQQLAQKNADAAKQQQLKQQHQQQLDQLKQKHDQQQQQLQKKQQDERKKEEKPSKPPKEEKPKKD